MLNKQRMKNLIRLKSIESGLPPQQLYGLYAMDQLLGQLSRSDFSKNLIVKGGFLLTTVYGLENRATGDLDLTVKGFELDKKNLVKLVESLQSSDEKTIFEIKDIKETRESFDYAGYEVKLIYHNENAKIPLNVDFTTGESLIPVQSFKKTHSLFSNEEYSIVGYSIEQIVTDKFYTLLAYGAVDDTNTRMKDYYDLYLLTKLEREINFDSVNIGLRLTMKQRNNFIDTERYSLIIEGLKKSNLQKELWLRFENTMPYAKGLKFEQVMDQILFFSNQL